MTRYTDLKFDLEWRTTLATAILLPSLVLLGFWQLERAEEKAGLAATWQSRSERSPVSLTELDWRQPARLAYTRVEMRGRFATGRYFLLDNRIRGGRFGYEVVALFEAQPGATPVLVNRGWIAGDPGRQSLPEVPRVEGELTLTGHVYVAPGKPYLLAEQVVEAGWPKRIQAIEMELLWTELGIAAQTGTFPYPVRLEAKTPGALAPDWQVINISPEKHIGYALQWFLMAAALGLFYIVRSSNLRQLVFGERNEPN